MEECAQQNMNGQGPSAGLNNVNRPEEENNQINQRPKYTIPGILHYLQHEWTRFEMEKSEWEANKAELEAKINFLQGECKGQENLKNDLIRRIKMLEFALKQERAKYHKLKYGTELIQGDITPPVFEETTKEKEVTMNELTLDTDAPFSSGNSLTWKQGRSLLRQYLQELGYTDTIIDVRSSRVKNLLGLYNNNNTERNNTVKPNSDEKVIRYRNHTMFSKNKLQDTRKGPKKTLVDTMMMDAESAVLGKLDFLSEEGQVAMEEDDDDDDFDVNEDNDDISKCKIKHEPMEEVPDVDAEAEEVLNELQTTIENEEAMVIRSQNVFPVPGIVSSAEDDTVDGPLALGDLAELTVSNDAETPYGPGTAKEPLRKTWSAKYTLRSHFDGVRALAFHPIEPILITASEDMTLKLWNLQKTVTAKKSASLDVEPLYTFRKHLSPVLSVAISGTGEQCYSGCLNGDINCWNIPFGNIDPYDTYDPSVLMGKFTGHTDAVWAIALHSQKPQLLSASADGTVKLWSPSQPNLPLLSTYVAELADGIPTCADFVRDDLNRMIVSYTSGRCIVFDLETCKPIFKMEQPAEKFPSDQINKVICHPTLPLTITAHEDRHIRFYDNTTGKMVHWMVAHLDAVTSLAVDPNGLFLLSGSHDCSIRLWNLDNKTCVQEMTAHRKKFDESIYDVAFHPSRPFIASCGADALAKVFV